MIALINTLSGSGVDISEALIETELEKAVREKRENNPENLLFAEWAAASPEARPAIEARLRPPMIRHGARLCWMILRQQNTQLVEAKTDDLLMRLSEFAGDSLFSTWVHRCFRTHFLDEFRFRRDRLGEPIPYGYDRPAPEGEAEARILFEQILARSSPEEANIIRLKAEGYTDVEVSESLGISRRSVGRILDSMHNRLVRRKLLRPPE